MQIRAANGRVWGEQRLYQRKGHLIVVAVHFDEAFVCAIEVTRHLVEQQDKAKGCPCCLGAIALGVILCNSRNLLQKWLCTGNELARPD